MTIVSIVSGLILFFSFIGGFAGFIFAPIASIASLPAYMVLSYVLVVADYGTRIPLASVVIPQFSIWFVVAAYGGMGVLYFRALGSEKVKKISKQTPNYKS